jgi:hypothetical protein
VIFISLSRQSPLICKSTVVSAVDCCPSLDLLRERTDQEQAESVSELSRLQKSYAFCEQQWLLKVAQHEGAKASHLAVVQAVRKWQNITPDPQMIINASSDIERTISALQNDLDVISGEKLRSIAERRARAEVNKIVASDYQVWRFHLVNL